MGYKDVYDAGGPSRGPKSPWRASPDSDVELVVEAKARFQELQKEAESLEEAYRNYQQRAVRSTISHMLTPRPLSPQQAFHSNRVYPPLRKQDSPQSSHQPKTLFRPQVPQSVKYPVLVLHDTRDTLQPTQPRVAFSENHDKPQTTHLTNPSHTLAEALFQKDEPPQDESSVASEHMSCTPQSSSRSKLQKGSREGNFMTCQNIYLYLPPTVPL